MRKKEVSKQITENNQLYTEFFCFYIIQLHDKKKGHFINVTSHSNIFTY